MKKPLFFGAFLVFAMLSSCSPDQDPDIISQPQQPSQPVTQPQSPYAYDADETQMGKLINDYRQDIGKSALSLHPYVSTLAEDHNSYMIANDMMSHDLFEQRATDLRETIGAFNIAENVAFNYQSSPGAFQAWLESEGHRTAIEGSFTHVGISVSSEPDDGRKFYTAIFVSLPQ